MRGKDDTGIRLTARRDFVLSDFSAESVSMDAENFGCPALIAFSPGKNRLNKLPFELAQRLIEQNPFVDHFGNERFQLLSHGGFLFQRRW
jgi:hypothetical protein